MLRIDTCILCLQFSYLQTINIPFAAVIVQLEEAIRKHRYAFVTVDSIIFF